jgi:hypothetical protein
MLAEFVATNRGEIISRCRDKVARRSSPPSTAEIDHGVPMFLDELLVELRAGLTPNPDISITAAKQGHDQLAQGFTPSQVVHGYGDVCQAITEMAVETDATISSDDFRMLNRCLDDAIASAITQYGSERDAATDAHADTQSNRMQVLGDALRVSVEASMIAFEAIESGKVGVSGSTGTLLKRTLQATRDVNQSIQAEIARAAINSPGQAADARVGNDAS